MRSYTSCKNTVHELLYRQINPKIKAMEYGRTMESVAKKNFEKIFGLVVKPVGLCVDEHIPYLAASPGIQSNFYRFVLYFFLNYKNNLMHLFLV